MIKLHRPSNITIILQGLSIIVSQLAVNVIYINNDQNLERSLLMSLCSIISISSILMAKNDKKQTEQPNNNLEIDMPMPQYVQNDFIQEIPISELAPTIQATNLSVKE